MRLYDNTRHVGQGCEGIEGEKASPEQTCGLKKTASTATIFPARKSSWGPNGEIPRVSEAQRPAGVHNIRQEIPGGGESTEVVVAMDRRYDGFFMTLKPRDGRRKHSPSLELEGDEVIVSCVEITTRRNIPSTVKPCPFLDETQSTTDNRQPRQRPYIQSSLKCLPKSAREENLSPTVFSAQSSTIFSPANSPRRVILAAMSE